jgi:hypothetical protein
VPSSIHATEVIATITDKITVTNDKLKDVKVCKPKNALTCPVKQSKHIRPLVAKMEINSLTTIVMFDTGSTSDAISPEFVCIANMKIAPFQEPILIQLSCHGSKLHIVYGTRCPLRYESITANYYFNIINIDRYNAILGIQNLSPLMNQILVHGKGFPALTKQEEGIEITHRQSMHQTEPRPAN